MLGARNKPWTPEHKALLGTVPDQKVVATTGHTLSSVRAMRRQLGIPNLDPKMRVFTSEEDSLLGTLPDKVLAVRLRRSKDVIGYRRRRLKIPMFKR